MLGRNGLMILLLLTVTARAARSDWVHPGPDGKLVYKTTERGDRMLDFSHAGYMGGGVALPDVPVKRTVKPSGRDDDTAVIQTAIDAVEAMPLKDGFRGAVLLEAGTFNCAGTLTINASGVVLRGSGSGIGKDSSITTIHMVGPKHRAIMVGRPRQAGGDRAANDEEVADAAAATQPEFEAAKTKVIDAYVPAGATSFTVAQTKGFAVGDKITIRRPTTAAWIHFMNMDTLVRDGRQQTWLRPGRDEIIERKITAIEGEKISIDIGMPDSDDAKLLNPPGVTISKVKPSTTITNVGVEHLHFQCPPLEVAYGQAPYSAIRVGGDDCWLRDIDCEELMNDNVLAGKRITAENVVCTHTYPNLGASKPGDFSIEGSQILIDRCKVTGDNEYFVWTASLHPGPNVILNSTFRGHGSRVQPHMRWSTGLLVDNCTVPDGGIDFCNRGVAGSGHGWTMGWAVAWNCIANDYVIQNPPGAVNWAIGCIGRRKQQARYFDTVPILPEGVFDSYEKPVAPQSLYLAQLQERLGADALKNIGYESNTAKEFPDRNTPKLPQRRAQIDPLLGPDMALYRPVNASSVRDNRREFGAEKALDGDEKSYWATNDDARRMSLEVDMEGPVSINAAEIREAAGMEQRVQEYRLEAQVDSDWKLLSRGTTIGVKKVDHFPANTVWKVRLSILKSESYPAISKLGLYLEADQSLPADKP